MQLTVVILNYNVCYFLELCLQSVFAAIKNIEAEVIVVDNNSADDSCKMVKENFPKAILVENKENVGFAKANNQAVAMAKGKYVCILNPDTVVGESVFENCLQKALVLPKLGLLGVQLIDGKGNFLPESKRNLPTPKVALLKFFGKHFSFLAPYYATHIKKNENGEVAILVGAFMFCETQKYLQLKGFDERYFMYGEDIDLSYTFTRSGYINYYLGNNQVIHFKGESSFKNSVYRERFFGAMHLFYKKYFKSSWVTGQIVLSGIKLASLLSVSKKDEGCTEFSKILVVTLNAKIEQRLAKAFNLPIEKVLIDDLMIYKNSNEKLLLIFDNEFVRISKIIEIMLAFTGANIHFRFVPKGKFYALGSDSSVALGNVVHF